MYGSSGRSLSQASHSSSETSSLTLPIARHQENFDNPVGAISQCQSSRSIFLQIYDFNNAASHFNNDFTNKALLISLVKSTFYSQQVDLSRGRYPSLPQTQSRHLVRMMACRTGPRVRKPEALSGWREHGWRLRDIVGLADRGHSLLQNFWGSEEAGGDRSCPSAVRRWCSPTSRSLPSTRRPASKPQERSLNKALGGLIVVAPPEPTGCQRRSLGGD